MGKKILLVALVALLALGVWIYFSPPAAVVAEVRAGRAIKAVPGSVTVQAEYEMQIRSEMGGRILRSSLEKGQHVSEGDILCELDAGDLLLNMERTRAEYETAKQRLAVGSAVELQLATSAENLAEYERLNRAGRYADAELTKRRREHEQVEQRAALEKVNNAQTLSSYETTLRQQQRQLEKMTLRAPFDGVVSQIYARPGDLIGGGAPIATLISTSRIVEAKISEEDFADIRVGQKVSVRFLPYGNGLFNGTVSKILPTADPATQRYVIELAVEIDAARLVPGITGEVTVVVGERDEQTLIPRRALFGSSVYVVRAGRVELRRVQVGYVSLTTVEITKGLSAGEQVIVDSLDQFREGQRVRAAPDGARS
ncbi:hypothetical protein AXK11_07715 [Cephaloticoccus primus]|uniref:Cyclic nucleotide-binding domain-containing protein n=1 Tax=Cephaloticoccus primus TaxID=1548207 RepID=A0A139SJJ7_9BACT|nr:efflux RND transporter periplasmic adaptor subunit [Cephaloticoccus primus]KXU34721.1 hypothetical protein AXK11_07715 [Cephaloticoccus primus]